MIHYGDVTLPDGRVVTGQITGYAEHSTGAYIVIDERTQLEWKDGAELTADEYNERVGGCYLHEFITDRLLEMPGEPDSEP